MTLSRARTTRLRMLALEWFSIAFSSCVRSRARSGVTKVESPFNAKAVSPGLDERSCTSVKKFMIGVSITHLLQQISGKHQDICVLIERLGCSQVSHGL